MCRSNTMVLLITTHQINFLHYSGVVSFATAWISIATPGPIEISSDRIGHKWHYFWSLDQLAGLLMRMKIKH